MPPSIQLSTSFSILCTQSWDGGVPVGSILDGVDRKVVIGIDSTIHCYCDL